MLAAKTRRGPKAILGDVQHEHLTPLVALLILLDLGVAQFS